MKVHSNLQKIVRDGQILILGPTGYQQWIKTEQSGWKEFKPWTDLTGFANCLGVTEHEVLAYITSSEVGYPGSLLPNKYQGGV